MQPIGLLFLENSIHRDGEDIAVRKIFVADVEGFRSVGAVGWCTRRDKVQSRLYPSSLDVP